MTTAPSLRALFAIGINQNFFDLPADGLTIGDVWKSFSGFLEAIRDTPGVDYIGDMDDDSLQVGPCTSWPWTAYVLADVDSLDTVKAVTGLLRTIQVGDGEAKLWRFARVEARIGRALTVRDDVELPE